MNWANPLRTIAPTVDADVLQVLAGTHEPVTGNQLAGLAERSYAQVQAVVGRLVSEGVVLMQQHGRTFTYELNREHVLADSLLAIIAAPEAAASMISGLVAAWPIPPVLVALFGSVARRTATADSDVDLLVVRCDNIPEDDTTWSNQIGSLARRIERLTGNRVQILDVSRAEFLRSIETNEPLIESLLTESRTLFGEDAQDLISRNRAP